MLENRHFGDREEARQFLGRDRPADLLDSVRKGHGKLNLSVIRPWHQGVTVNAVLLVALPPGVVKTTFPVFAPLGTVKVTC